MFNIEDKKIFEETGLKIPTIPENYKTKNRKKELKFIEFKTPDSLLKYLEDEKSFWSSYKNKNYFNKWFNSYANAVDIFKSQYINMKQKINDVQNQIKNIPSSQSVLVQKMLKVDEEDAFYVGFLDAIDTKRKDANHSNIYLRGFIEGLNFLGVKKNINEITDIQKEIFDNLQSNFINSSEDQIKKYNDFINTKELEYALLETDSRTEINKLRNEYTSFVEERNNELDNLRKTYNELLKLEAPAKYWEQLEKEYKKSGNKWLIASLILAIIAIVALLSIVKFFPEIYTASTWFGITKTTAILTVIISLLIYAIRISVKMTMSSYHLSRDARERQQLTFFYLALTKDADIKENERELVFSALFSRSDTGLLKGDSGPEMPSIKIIEK